MNEPTQQPELLKAADLEPASWGKLDWNATHNADTLTASNDGKTITWGPKKPENNGKHYPPAWVPATTNAKLYGGNFNFDFDIDEMANRQIGVGFMLLWDVGPDWGFFGYLGASSTAWSYDPSTGDVVANTESIQGNLPKFGNGRNGTVSLNMNLPVHGPGQAAFSVNGITSNPIELPVGAVVLPAACFLAESQQVTLGELKSKNAE
jgi:hypothetical protein